tara:strand:+ start:279 stop:458 length:180 start_codon:yes stop_codon:yes gene_type:complete
MGPFSDKEIQFFKDCWNPIKDTEIFIKHHLFVYKRYMLDQSLEGVAQKMTLPRPLQVQN